MSFFSNPCAEISLLGLDAFGRNDPFTPLRAYENGGDPPLGQTVWILMSQERELDLWSYPHFLRYLRAIVLRLTPQPHHTVEPVLDVMAAALAENRPCVMDRRFWPNLPARKGPGGAARMASNGICAVMNCWTKSLTNDDQLAEKLVDELAALRRLANSPLLPRPAETKTERASYEGARNAVREIELMVLTENLLTNEDLMMCALAAHGDDPIDDRHRDAALAAMTAGHWRLAYEIATRKESE